MGDITQTKKKLEREKGKYLTVTIEKKNIIFRDAYW